MPGPLRLASVKKGYSFDQDKAVDPGTTVKSATAKLNAVEGIGAVTLEARPNAVSGSFAFTSAGSSFNASGKGLTAEQAQASAVMEFAERYSWLHYDFENAPGYRLASHAALEAEGVLTVPRSYFFNNFLPFAHRESYEADAVSVPIRFVQGTRLGDGASYAYPLNWHNMVFGSNGLAAGNRIEEAIVQGLCEVIERETVFRLHMERRLGAELDLDSLRHPLLKEVLANGRAQGIAWTILDITSDLGVPSFVVRGTREQDLGLLTWQGVGHGCHPDPEKAVIRATSEYFEGLSIMWNLQQGLGADAKGLRSFLPKSNLGFHALFNPEVLDQSTGRRRIDEIGSLASPDIKDELDALTLRLSERGFSVVVIDKSFAPLGIPVVRVFVPEMRSGSSSEFQSPAAPLAAVCLEGGAREAGMKYWLEMFRDHPALKVMRLNDILSFMLPALPQELLQRPFGKDYREAMLTTGTMKKHGLSVLQQFEKGLGGPAGMALQMLQSQGGDPNLGMTSMLSLALGALNRSK